MNELKEILSKQLALYKEFSEKEKTREVDSSYIYDMSCEWFQDLSRADYQRILEILSLEEGNK